MWYFFGGVNRMWRVRFWPIIPHKWKWLTRFRRAVEEELRITYFYKNYLVSISCTVLGTQELSRIERTIWLKKIGRIGERTLLQRVPPFKSLLYSQFYKWSMAPSLTPKPPYLYIVVLTTSLTNNFPYLLLSNFNYSNIFILHPNTMDSYLSFKHCSDIE